MENDLDILLQRMKAAAAALDYEEAKRCRDMISLMRGGATLAEAAEADLSGVDRQQPGAMGLGTSQQKRTPPPGWTPPVKPDPMTAGHNSRRRGRR